MSNKKDFFEEVYEVVKLIPYGRATSYGAIARYLGAAKSSRIVGYAMNNCHSIDINIPAHRVVNRNGLLTGKAHFGDDTMEKMLQSEGINVIEDQIQNWQSVFWDPNIELL
jgi:methylated-DNA-protein-cysteine methyltransferase related protein